MCYKWFAAPLAFSLDFHILVAFNFAYSVSMRLTISHSVSHCVFYSGSAHSHSVSHRVQDVAMMSAKCPLNCSAVELWYKIMLEIRNQSDLTENHIKRKPLVISDFLLVGYGYLWLFTSRHLPMQNFIKIFPNTSSAVISPPTISARWKRHSRKSWLMKSPER